MYTWDGNTCTITQFRKKNLDDCKQKLWTQYCIETKGRVSEITMRFPLPQQAVRD